MARVDGSHLRSSPRDERRYRRRVMRPV